MYCINHYLKFSLVFFLVVFISDISLAQVGISDSGTLPDESAMLDIVSTTKGTLITRMTSAERENIVNPATGLLVYQTDPPIGFYYNQGEPGAPEWKLLQASGDSDCNTRIPIDATPYIISAPGSYYLTQHIDGEPSNTGITIESGNVSIDLNGYTLQGDGGGTFSAILASGSINNIAISNGHIDNWGGNGIGLTTASNVLVYNVQVTNSGINGIATGTEASINHCLTKNNGFDGILCGANSQVSHCTSIDNTFDGIDGHDQCIISNTNTYSNGSNGVELSSRGVIENCIAHQNSSDGFDVGVGSTISNSIATNNSGAGFSTNSSGNLINNQARANTGNGFYFQSDTNASNNIADNNIQSGFYVTGNDTRLDSNQSTDNGQNGFNVTGSGNIIIRNSASGNSSIDFNVVGANAFATVLTTATLNSNTNPYANISF